MEARFLGSIHIRVNGVSGLTYNACGHPKTALFENGLPYRRRVIRCVGSVLSDHITGDRQLEIASRATTYTGLPRHRALTNLMQQLSVVLWRYNARLLRSQLDLSDDVSGWDLAG